MTALLEYLDLTALLEYFDFLNKYSRGPGQNAPAPPVGGPAYAVTLLDCPHMQCITWSRILYYELSMHLVANGHHPTIDIVIIERLTNVLYQLVLGVVARADHLAQGKKLMFNQKSVVPACVW